MFRKAFVILLVLIMTTLFTVGMAQELNVDKKSVKFTEKGEKALVDKQFDKAVENYNKALEIAPEYGPANLGLAKVYLTQKNWAQAQLYTDKAVAVVAQYPVMSGNLVNVLLNLGQGYNNQNQLKEANDSFIKLVALPGIKEQNKVMLARVLYQIGANFFSLKDAQGANKYLAEFMATHEENPELAQLILNANYLLGVGLSQTKEFTKANEYFVKFLQLTESNPTHQLIPYVHYFFGSNKFDNLETEIKKFAPDQVDAVAELAKKNEDVLASLNKADESTALPAILKEEIMMKKGNYLYYCQDLDNAIATYETLISTYAGSDKLASYKDFLAKLKEAKARKENAAKAATSKKKAK